jgi:hypothetical protein
MSRVPREPGFLQIKLVFDHPPRAIADFSLSQQFVQSPALGKYQLQFDLLDLVCGANILFLVTLKMLQSPVPPRFQQRAHLSRQIAIADNLVHAVGHATTTAATTASSEMHNWADWIMPEQ